MTTQPAHEGAPRRATSAAITAGVVTAGVLRGVVSAQEMRSNVFCNF